MRELTATAGPQVRGGEDLVITRGTCSALFAYDLGFGIDLNRAQQLLQGDVPQRETLKHSRRAPKYFEYQPAPLRVSRTGTPVSVGRFTTQPVIEALVYDFGAVSIKFTIPIDGSAADLLTLSNALYDNAAMLSESKRLVAELVATLKPSVTKPSVAAMVEDYIVFDVNEWFLPAGQVSLQEWVQQCRGLLARILRSDTQLLSQQEVDDALSCQIAYTDEDVAIIDWNGSLLLGRDMQDVAAVLEFANVELLEMRYLDDQLDRALTDAYEATQRRHALGFLRPGADLRRIASLQIDSAILFEGVNNALKLLGDVYLSRVYRLAAGRMHLPDWDASIIRKLGSLESIYDKLNDRQANRRMEVLEWIIILLILFEVVMSFVRH